MYFDHFPSLHNTEDMYVSFYMELQVSFNVIKYANMHSVIMREILETTWNVEKRNRHQQLSSLCNWHNSAYFILILSSQERQDHECLHLSLKLFASEGKGFWFMDTKRHWEKGLMFIAFFWYQNCYFAGFLTNIFLPLERLMDPKTGTFRNNLIDFISGSFKSNKKTFHCYS